MIKYKLSLSKYVLLASLSPGLLLVTGLGNAIIAVEFKSPGDSAPNNSVGGGARGNVQFATPGDATPSDSVGGGTRGNVQFGIPGDRAPSGSVGGGSRGNVQFGIPGDRAPSGSMGGGSRGDVQFGIPGDRAPNSSEGGGTRGDVQFGLPGDRTPNSSEGGGTRGDVQFGLPGDRTPSDSAGGGARSEPPPAMTAVLPPTKVGRTISAHPTFFVYLPPTLSKEVFFSLQDEQGNSHYQTRLKISGQGGIVSITLPATAPALEIGKNYVWVFAPIQPDGILRPDNYLVNGWVKRVPATSITASSPLEQATALAQAGIWYDTLSVLATAKRSQPNNPNLVKEWKELLEQVGLNAIATQPLSERL